MKNYYKLYKVGRYCIEHNLKIFIPFLNLAKRFLFPATDIPFTCVIGSGAYFPHRAIGVVIQESAVLGNNVKVLTNVTIGGKKNKGVPVIGDNVEIGTGASILGGVKIGNGAVIGAGAVVVTDVPEGAVFAGVPAKQINIV